MSDRLYAVPSGHRYRYNPTHPLAHPTHGTVYEGRRVFLAAHGEGPHACERCSAVLRWPDLQVWRVNGWPGDDRPENLAPRCYRCARMRHPSRVRAVTLTHEGATLTVAEWAARVGLLATTIHGRLRRRWSVRDALTVPAADGSERRFRFIERGGLSRTLPQWAAEAGLSIKCVESRLRLGWTLDDALTVPSGHPRHAPFQPRREAIESPPGVVENFGETSGDRAPSTTRKNVELGSQKPKRSDLDG